MDDGEDPVNSDSDFEYEDSWSRSKRTSSGGPGRGRGRGRGRGSKDVIIKKNALGNLLFNFYILLFLTSAFESWEFWSKWKWKFGK